jgi:hypothetical protein
MSKLHLYPETRIPCFRWGSTFYCDLRRHWYDRQSVAGRQANCTPQTAQALDYHSLLYHEDGRDLGLHQTGISPHTIDDPTLQLPGIETYVHTWRLPSPTRAATKVLKLAFLTHK